MADLFSTAPAAASYSAEDIEVLEGLEPVRRRPGMYIGGTDQAALHHLLAELLDNAMDEAVAGHATRIEVSLNDDGSATVADNGRGIPIDPHPRFPDRSALEVILTTLHSGGKFGSNAYKTSGGLHGVGVSVVNALSQNLVVEVARDRMVHRQTYARGVATSPLAAVGSAANRRGTTVTFFPDVEIFGADLRFDPERLYRLVRSKAYLFAGVEVRWRCAESLLPSGHDVPAAATMVFPGGLADYLGDRLAGQDLVGGRPFTGVAQLGDDGTRLDWAIAWPVNSPGFCQSYCNTIPTPQGGTHESGLRMGLVRGLRSFADLTAQKRASVITADDAMAGAGAMLSVFLTDPQFQGQTKDRLTSAHATRLVEAAIKDHFEHWLSADPIAGTALLSAIQETAEERIRRRTQKETERKSATRRLRLPGKLADCSRAGSAGTEIFLVEGDSAGGTAKTARQRDTQAILPLRGKIMNVASASAEKLTANQEIANLVLALGCGTRTQCDPAKLRYERVIIMTDADVDGAHIASLLITYFWREMAPIIEHGHLFLAQPPLYRLSHGGVVRYARDDDHKNALLASDFKPNAKVDISRFKGLGEMSAAQLKETTMLPTARTLLRVAPGDGAGSDRPTLVDRLMGRNPEPRLRFIQDHAGSVEALDI